MFGYLRLKSNQNFLANVSTFFFLINRCTDLANHPVWLTLIISLCRCPFSFCYIFVLSPFILFPYLFCFLPLHGCHTNGIFDICLSESPATQEAISHTVYEWRHWNLSFIPHSTSVTLASCLAVPFFSFLIYVSLLDD